MANIKIFFSKKEKGVGDQHSIQNPLTKAKSPREQKVPDPNGISCPLICLTSFTLSLQQIRDPESTLFPLVTSTLPHKSAVPSHPQTWQQQRLWQKVYIPT